MFSRVLPIIPSKRSTIFSPGAGKSSPSPAPGQHLKPRSSADAYDVLAYALQEREIGASLPPTLHRPLHFGNRGLARPNGRIVLVLQLRQVSRTLDILPGVVKSHASIPDDHRAARQRGLAQRRLQLAQVG